MPLWQAEDAQATQFAHNPLDLQYRLFKLYFYQEIEDHSPEIRVFTFYEDSPCTQILLGNSFRWLGGHWYSKQFPVDNAGIAKPPWLCLVHIDLETYTDSSTNADRPKIINRLITRLIRDDKNINTLDGHINTVLLCLTTFAEVYPGGCPKPW